MLNLNAPSGLVGDIATIERFPKWAGSAAHDNASLSFERIGRAKAIPFAVTDTIISYTPFPSLITTPFCYGFLMDYFCNIQTVVFKELCRVAERHCGL